MVPLEPVAGLVTVTSQAMAFGSVVWLEPFCTSVLVMPGLSHLAGSAGMVIDAPGRQRLAPFRVIVIFVVLPPFDAGGVLGLAFLHCCATAFLTGIFERRVRVDGAGHLPVEMSPSEQVPPVMLPSFWTPESLTWTWMGTLFVLTTLMVHRA
ncbi:hypothetical protein [Tepidiforma sp.]|uniref:hypothetical protein n=1 Tax=Tepidiforma sp. TaxID=2682230 RepID=UPI00258AE81D|nr:hypothetical protein [Tepidiforma sp.]